jgi:2-dehydro-3-deoxyphosphogluconate aldolase/(4S)-4-hydroxy-2-oxoglutarate aldolase
MSAAIDAIRTRRVVAILRRVEDPELVVLAGTVRTAHEAKAAAEAGAQACVGPALVPEVLEACGAFGVPVPDVPLLVTGGVDASNAGAFLRAGTAAVGVGTALVAANDVAAAARDLVGSARDA